MLDVTVHGGFLPSMISNDLKYESLNDKNSPNLHIMIAGEPFETCYTVWIMTFINWVEIEAFQTSEWHGKVCLGFFAHNNLHSTAAVKAKCWCLNISSFRAIWSCWH